MAATAVAMMAAMMPPMMPPVAPAPAVLGDSVRTKTASGHYEELMAASSSPVSQIPQTQDFSK